MKQVIMGVLVLSIVLFVAGCLDYKAYDAAGEQEDAALLDEIASIENELVQDNTVGEAVQQPEVEEEVILPTPEEGAEVAEEVVEEELYTLTVKESQLVRVRVNISDPDGDSVTYSFSKPLNNEGEWQTNYGDAGEYIVTLSATDGVHTTEKKIKVVVERVNVPPTVEGVKDITVSEGEVVSFEPTVIDPNKDAVNVAITEPLKEGTWETDHTSAGEYQIRVVASDGELETEKVFKLTVRDVNVKPEIANVEDLSVKEGEVVTITPVVSDLDNDLVTVTISDPVGNDGVWETTYTDHGDYQITITADDGKDRVVKTVTVVVQDVNVPPVIKNIYLG